MVEFPRVCSVCDLAKSNSAAVKHTLSLCNRDPVLTDVRQYRSSWPSRFTRVYPIPLACFCSSDFCLAAGADADELAAACGTTVTAGVGATGVGAGGGS